MVSKNVNERTNVNCSRRETYHSFQFCLRTNVLHIDYQSKLLIRTHTVLYTLYLQNSESFDFLLQ